MNLHLTGRYASKIVMRSWYNVSNRELYLRIGTFSSKLKRTFYIVGLRFNSGISYHNSLAQNLEYYIPERIRNFCIIAHIDHGKSTIADRLLEYTGTIRHAVSNKQVLDKLPVERQRGITVKAQTASMFHCHYGQKLLLNLIDTPGHVDFSYEVSRSFGACQGAVLVVDAAQGIQAQTVANYHLACQHNLEIIPVINKIDLQSANPDAVAEQMENFFGFKKLDIVMVSAKTGTGIDKLVSRICESVPRPCSERNASFSALLIDSWYDRYKGVICQLFINSGVLYKEDQVVAYSSKEQYEITNIGILNPERVKTSALFAGQVGYIMAGMKNTKEALVGDTFHRPWEQVNPFPGFMKPKPMVFAGFYPSDQSMYTLMKSALDKLSLNDASVVFHSDNTQALGQGWRLGFMGLLHMEVFKQRLEDEYDLRVIVTTPNVPYKAILKAKGQEVDILTPADFPEYNTVDTFQEPVIIGTILCPETYLGKVVTLCENKRGTQVDLDFVGETRVIIRYKLPLCEVVLDFFDQLKLLSSGYASFDYEDAGFENTELEKVEILLNGNSVDSLSFIVHKSQVRSVGKHMCNRLRDLIPRQMFEVVIQAQSKKKIISRETIRPYRKNVTAKCYGGDITRKQKLLERQKEGKKHMKKIGNVNIPDSAFIALLKR